MLSKKAIHKLRQKTTKKLRRMQPIAADDNTEEDDTLNNNYFEYLINSASKKPHTTTEFPLNVKVYEHIDNDEASNHNVKPVHKKNP